MSAPAPSAEQQAVIDCASCAVVIAAPGSGKTFTLARRVQRVAPTLADHQGIIAISYTNKASDELKRRARAATGSLGSSFFGTIDSFLLSEIILPFGRRLFGKPVLPLEVVPFERIPDDARAGVTRAELSGEDGFSEAALAWYAEMYRTGKVILDGNGPAASLVLEHSHAAVRYLRARYREIYIDEYQDCGFWQHRVFLTLVDAGLVGIAVGDLNQSIFGFAGRDPKYLKSLLEDGRFEEHQLTTNRRCHPSIALYASKMLSPRVKAEVPDDPRVYHRHIRGDEEAVGVWIGTKLTTIMKHFGIEERRECGVLVRSKRTAELVLAGLNSTGVPCRYRRDTALDQESSPWARVFRALLDCLFTKEHNKFEFLEGHIDIELRDRDAAKLMKQLDALQALIRGGGWAVDRLLDDFCGVASAIYPLQGDDVSVQALREALTDKDQLETYRPPAPGEVNILTLHKAKGLEFSLVFHLDLCRFILPIYNATPWQIRQDLNLHYVGVTRARSACFLCSSTLRTRADGTTTNAEPSEFLNRPGLESLRQQ